MLACSRVFGYERSAIKTLYAGLLALGSKQAVTSHPASFEEQFQSQPCCRFLLVPFTLLSGALLYCRSLPGKTTTDQKENNQTSKVVILATQQTQVLEMGSWQQGQGSLDEIWFA